MKDLLLSKGFEFQKEVYGFGIDNYYVYTTADEERIKEILEDSNYECSEGDSSLAIEVREDFNEIKIIINAGEEDIDISESELRDMLSRM
ncbi:hypothetical protein [uncultured Clostridium sp.]|uniref:hypothetical protein n=1 Tax=uncultured Clostridium sp. TaxID=59620 RepID=UPI00321728FC